MSLYGILRTYGDNKDKIENYLDDRSANSDKKIAGMAIGLFVALVIIAIVIWVWAAVVLVRYWHYLPQWTQTIGVLGLLPVVPLGPVVTLVVVYISISGQKLQK